MIVACEGGELVAVPTDPTGAPALIARLDRDLRDVVIAGGHIYVSRFRSAGDPRPLLRAAPCSRGASPT